MNPMNDLIIDVIEALEACGIPYMVVGSLASAIYGEPRSTNDADIVVNPSSNQLDAFLERLKDNYHTFPDAARTALRSRTMFNIIKKQPYQKADLIPLKPDQFNQAEFSRRRKGMILGKPAFVITPEDCILSKLDWARKSESERQIRDVVGILKLQGAGLDQDYLGIWAERLGVGKLLSQAKDEVLRLSNR